MKGNEKEGQANTGQPECAEDEARLIGDLIREIMDRQGFLRPALPVRPQGGDLNKNGGSDFQAAPSRLTKCVKVSGGIHAACVSTGSSLPSAFATSAKCAMRDLGIPI